MSEPTTVAGRALMDELADFYGVGGSGIDIGAVEQEARDKERVRILDELTAWATTHGALRAGRGNSDDVFAFITWLRS